MKQQKDIQAVIKDLREIFGLTEDTSPNRETNGKFYIHKSHLGRGVVLAKLVDYFDKVSIIDGQVEVKPMTLIYTVFEVKKN